MRAGLTNTGTGPVMSSKFLRSFLWDFTAMAGLVLLVISVFAGALAVLTYIVNGLRQGWF